MTIFSLYQSWAARNEIKEDLSNCDLRKRSISIPDCGTIVELVVGLAGLEVQLRPFKEIQKLAKPIRRCSRSATAHLKDHWAYQSAWSDAAHFRNRYTLPHVRKTACITISLMHLCKNKTVTSKGGNM
jgi:hypothetical protein